MQIGSNIDVHHHQEPWVMGVLMIRRQCIRGASMMAARGRVHVGAPAEVIVVLHRRPVA